MCAFSTNFKTSLKGFCFKDSKKQKEKNLTLFGEKALKFCCFGTMEVMAVWISSSTLCLMKKICKIYFGLQRKSLGSLALNARVLSKFSLLTIAVEKITLS